MTPAYSGCHAPLFFSISSGFALEQDVRRVVRQVEEKWARLVFLDESLRVLRQLILALAALGRARLRVRATGDCDIEALFLRPEPRPAEMPLADARRDVAGLAQHLREREFLQRELPFENRLKHFLRRSIGPARQEIRDVQPRRIFPREQRRARRRAHGLPIRIREPHPLPCELVEVRRVVIGATVAVEIVDAEIVREDEDDVRLVRSEGHDRGDENAEEETEELHARRWHPRRAHAASANSRSGGLRACDSAFGGG